MLTGDKLETAISISLSCQLFTRGTKLMIIRENDLADGRQAVSEALLVKATEAAKINAEELQQGRRSACACTSCCPTAVLLAISH